MLQNPFVNDTRSSSRVLEAPTTNAYIDWLQNQGVRLYRSGGTYWRLYNGILLPASTAPVFLSLSHGEAHRLLNESGAWLLRFTSEPTKRESPWWYVVCDAFDPAKLTSKLRNQIKHGIRHCAVKRIDARWFSEHGYAIYLAAHQRYKHTRPISEDKFKANVLGTQGAPVEYWGGFVGDKLAAYTQCTIEANNVDTTVTRFSPEFFRLHIAHAMIHCLITHYVVTQGKILSNGERSIAHPTNFQDFLIQFGFKKMFCRLNIEYRWWLAAALRLAQPFSKMTPSSAGGLLGKIQALIAQEEIRKSCY